MCLRKKPRKPFVAIKGSAGKSREELALEKKRELERRLQDVSGQLNSVKKPQKTKAEKPSAAEPHAVASRLSASSSSSDSSSSSSSSSSSDTSESDSDWADDDDDDDDRKKNMHSIPDHDMQRETNKEQAFSLQRILGKIKGGGGADGGNQSRALLSDWRLVSVSSSSSALCIYLYKDI